MPKISTILNKRWKFCVNKKIDLLLLDDNYVEFKFSNLKYHLLFNEIYISIEETRKRLKALKEAQTSELYDTNISFMAMNLFNVVSVLCASPKARVISSRNVTFGHHYKKAEASLPIPDKKRKSEVLKK